MRNEKRTIKFKKDKTMKKIYLQPTTEVINIKSQQPLLTASMQVFSDIDVNDPTKLLAPELPDLPGLDLPGMNLPGMGLPE